MSNWGKDFTFSEGKMTKEVLRNYLSRAVSFQGLCIENTTKDALFEEDLRMIKRIGAKFIGRTAFYSWAGNLTYEQIEYHFKTAEEQAMRAHEVDPELILQAGVFEIMFEGTVNSTPIPKWVLKEFAQEELERNFSFDKMLPPEGSKFGRGYWGGKMDAAVPYIGSVETQMYTYYLICRYIDAGFEAVHLGQVEFITNLDDNQLPNWDSVLTKARAYAKEHARRGVVLFDGHKELNSSNFKIGDRMMFDHYACGAVTHETEVVNGAECAQLLHYKDRSVSWIGRTPGGIHPFGFYMDKAFTIAEFDNFNGTCGVGVPHTITYDDVFCWGYDMITWFATQPEWYRNQYLLECDKFLKSVELDNEGNQTYFMQHACRRVICPEKDDRPIIKLNVGKDFDINSLDELFKTEEIKWKFDEDTGELIMTQEKESFYRANYRSEACVTGSSQEDTIRHLFLGENVPEVTEFLPNGYKIRK